jgi:Mrp family chromosome partitioning ATPase
MFEKVVNQAKKANQKPAVRPTETSAGGTATEVQDLSKASGLFRILSFASVQTETMEKNKIIPAVEDKTAIAAFKILRTRVLQRMRAEKWNNLIVSGAGSGEGKSLTACNLAVSISRDVNQTVFLVDLDLQRPSISEYFGLDVKAGIGDYLAGDAKIEDIMYSPKNLDRIVIIPNREPVEGSSELLASPRIRDLLNWLKERAGHPLTIFDMPPILACDDVLAFYPLADALLLVASEGITHRDALSRAVDMLNGCNLLGVVLNQSKEHNKSSSYYGTPKYY